MDEEEFAPLEQEGVIRWEPSEALIGHGGECQRCFLKVGNTMDESCSLAGTQVGRRYLPSHLAAVALCGQLHQARVQRDQHGIEGIHHPVLVHVESRAHDHLTVWYGVAVTWVIVLNVMKLDMLERARMAEGEVDESTPEVVRLLEAWEGTKPPYGLKPVLPAYRCRGSWLISDVPSVLAAIRTHLQSDGR